MRSSFKPGADWEALTARIEEEAWLEGKTAIALALAILYLAAKNGNTALGSPLA